MSDSDRPRGRILVVDDSPTQRRFVMRALEGTGTFEVCATAEDGLGALAAVRRHAPDAVVLDVDMPRLDGVETARQLRAQGVHVVLFCGTASPAARRRALEALAAGATTLVPKPGPDVAPDVAAAELVRALTALAGSRPRPAPASRPRDRRPSLVVVGASTGGPPALQAVLRAIGPLGPTSVVVVQHIVPAFLPSFAEWLADVVPHPVRVAEEGPLPRGQVLVAPGGTHCLVEGEQVRLERAQPRNSHCPSIDVLFESAALHGASAVGVLLTGMGDDGARGLLALREAGALTLCEDAGATVDGMPQAARRLGAAELVLPLSQIGAAISAALVSSPVGAPCFTQGSPSSGGAADGRTTVQRGEDV